MIFCNGHARPATHTHGASTPTTSSRTPHHDFAGALALSLSRGDLDRASGSIRSWLPRASALKRYSECSGESRLDADRCRERPTREVATLGSL